MRRRVIHFFLLSVFLLSVALLNTAAFAQHACTDCHNSDTPGAIDLKQPLSSLCVNCHQDRVAAGEHQVGIPATYTAGTTLPLQNGVMTCATCHDPHQEGLALRITRTELCIHCHKR